MKNDNLIKIIKECSDKNFAKVSNLVEAELDKVIYKIISEQEKDLLELDDIKTEEEEEKQEVAQESEEEVVQSDAEPVLTNDEDNVAESEEEEEKSALEPSHDGAQGQVLEMEDIISELLK